MARPVQSETGTLVRVAVTADGRDVTDGLLIRSISVEKPVNRIPRATLHIADGSVSEETFELSSSDTFVPGTKITISAGYDDRLSEIYRGIVIRHAISIDEGGETNLTLSCADPAIAMTLNRRSRFSADSSDAAMMARIISDAGLRSDIAGADEPHEHIVQNDATDWDFLQTRAAANALVLIAEDGRISLRPPDFSAPEYEVRFGRDLISFEAELDAAGQVAAVEATSWDPGAQATVTSGAAEPDTDRQGNLTGRKLSGVLPDNIVRLRSFGTASQATLDTWAGARMLRSRMSRIRGRARFPGIAGIRPGRTLELAGLGDRFNGPAWVSCVTHRISPGTWTTEAETGFEPLRTNRSTVSPPAAGLRPGAAGLQIAKVARVYDDPQNRQRILVTLPLSENAQIWVRVMASYASAGAGFTFRPEPGDEVVIAFLDDDPENPVCLGGLHSSARPAPDTAEETNTLKTIRTRSGLALQFDDNARRIALTSPDGKRFVLDEEAGTVALSDAAGNEILLEKSGLSLKSAGDITIDAAGDLKISTGAAAQLEVSGDLKARSANISLKADMAFSAKGGSSGELTGGGTVRVKGTLVEIN